MQCKLPWRLIRWKQKPYRPSQAQIANNFSWTWSESEGCHHWSTWDRFCCRMDKRKAMLIWGPETPAEYFCSFGKYCGHAVWSVSQLRLASFVSLSTTCSLIGVKPGRYKSSFGASDYCYLWHIRRTNWEEPIWQRNKRTRLRYPTAVYIPSMLLAVVARSCSAALPRQTLFHTMTGMALSLWRPAENVDQCHGKDYEASRLKIKLLETKRSGKLKRLTLQLQRLFGNNSGSPWTGLPPWQEIVVEKKVKTHARIEKMHKTNDGWISEYNMYQWLQFPVNVLMSYSLLQVSLRAQGKRTAPTDGSAFDEKWKVVSGDRCATDRNNAAASKVDGIHQYLEQTDGGENGWLGRCRRCSWCKTECNFGWLGRGLGENCEHSFQVLL